VRIAKALRFTDMVAPDVPPPKSGGLSTGFLPGGYMGADIACSSSVSHAHGRNDKTTTQNSRHLFSTKKLALQAQRNKLEREYAEKLARIDEQIEAEDSTGEEN
jgi:hypothetical protein